MLVIIAKGAAKSVTPGVAPTTPLEAGILCHDQGLAGMKLRVPARHERLLVLKLQVREESG